jgi:hypothetical protein
MVLFGKVPRQLMHPTQVVFDHEALIPCIFRAILAPLWSGKSRKRPIR